MRTITLDLERMTSVPALHKYLRSALALPVYYGANLDALYDCLTEIAEPTQIVVPADITDNEKLGWYGEQLLLFTFIRRRDIILECKFFTGR